MGLIGNQSVTGFFFSFNSLTILYDFLQILCTCIIHQSYSRNYYCLVRCTVLIVIQDINTIRSKVVPQSCTCTCKHNTINPVLVHVRIIPSILYLYM